MEPRLIVEHECYIRAENIGPLSIMIRTIKLMYYILIGWLNYWIGVIMNHMSNQATFNWKDNNSTIQDIGNYSELHVLREMQVRNESVYKYSLFPPGCWYNWWRALLRSPL